MKLLCAFLGMGVFLLWGYSISKGEQDKYNLNALFTGLSVIALVYTIIVQQEEITKSNREFQWQRFENTFFSMLSLHEIIKGNLWQGKGSFYFFYEKFIWLLDEKTSIAEMKDSYKSTSKAMAMKELGQYFSNFESIVELVMSRKKEKGNQTKYLKIYFAQLTITERIVILYHYNLTSFPKYWNDFKGELFAGIEPGYLHNPVHAGILDGISLK